MIYTHPNFFQPGGHQAPGGRGEAGQPGSFRPERIQAELLDLCAGTAPSCPPLQRGQRGGLQRRAAGAPGRCPAPRAGPHRALDLGGVPGEPAQADGAGPGAAPEVGMPQHFSGMQYLSQWVFAGGGAVWSRDLKACLLDSPASGGGPGLPGPPAPPGPGGHPAGGAHRVRQERPGRASHIGGVGLRLRATTELCSTARWRQEGARLGVAPVPQGPAGRAPAGRRTPGASGAGARPWTGPGRRSAPGTPIPCCSGSTAPATASPLPGQPVRPPGLQGCLAPLGGTWKWSGRPCATIRILATPGRQTEIDELWVRLWPQARDGRRTVKDLLAEFAPGQQPAPASEVPAPGPPLTRRGRPAKHVGLDCRGRW